MARFPRTLLETRDVGLSLRLPARAAGWTVTGVMLVALAASLQITGRAAPGLVVAVLLAQLLPRPSSGGEATP